MIAKLSPPLHLAWIMFAGRVLESYRVRGLADGRERPGFLNDAAIAQGGLIKAARPRASREAIGPADFNVGGETCDWLLKTLEEISRRLVRTPLDRSSPPPLMPQHIHDYRKPQSRSLALPH